MPRKRQGVRGGWAALGMAAVLTLAGRDTAAQDQSLAVQALTVQPRTMATGTKNPAAGEYPLDSVPKALVVVPPQCAGERRCPLLVQLPGGGQPASVMTGWMGPVADKYGLMLLAFSEGGYRTSNVVDAGLKETLRRFAIDPEQIAVAGRCASGKFAMRYGITSLHVFSRIISVSGGVPIDGMDATNKTAEFLIDRGYEEVPDNFQAAQALRADGHPVTVVLALRGHEHQSEDYDYVGYWLQRSWAHPKPASRPAPAVIANPVPTLTSETLAKMTAFWTSFAKQPDSIRLTGRRAFLHEVIVPIGAEQPSVWMTDMTAFAAKYPSVAADLKRAGLTAQQHDAYRVAMIGAMVTRSAESVIDAGDANSPPAKNVAFLNEHAEEFEKLTSAGIDDPLKAGQIGGCCTNPAQVDQMGPLGIWRTP